MKRIYLLICLFSSMIFFEQCAKNPVTGKSQLVLMSEEQEIAMGKEADPQIVAQFGLYPDKELQAFITQKGKQLAAISHRPGLNYEFKILDSDVLNAFATPGGYVYFTRGIMANFNNEAQFAGVLGHEVGHITARHSVAQQRNAMLGQLGILAGVIINPQLGQFAQTASQGLGLLFLKFGRDAERQADELGVEYSSKLGYDANEMADFFTTLERQGQQSGADQLPDFLSTHPNPGDRNAKVHQLANKYQRQHNMKDPIVNRNTFLKRIEGMVYGEDPRQGYREGNAFYHPELKFQFPVPAGWKYQNSPQAVQMAPPDGKALLMLTLAQGNDLQTAANAVLQQNNLQLLDSKQVSVNGLNAIALASAPKAVQGQQQQDLRVLSYLIQYGGNIYHLLGVTPTSLYNQYGQYFLNTMQGFAQLTDQSKLNKKPDRIRLKTVKTSTTVENALKGFSVPSSKLDEHALLNGMKLTDKVPRGTMLKVIGS
jgi:predicted Zn-dependent protease